MKRSYQVKVTGKPPFTMGGFEPFDDAEHICRSIFGSRFQWVR